MNQHDLSKINREEYSLNAFLKLNPEFHYIEKIKEKRPDYILIQSDGSKVGIEITELSVQDDYILPKIITTNRGKVLTPEQLRENAVKEHGEKAKRYSYYTYNSHIAIGSPIMDLNMNRKQYVKQILRKYDKYVDDMDKFNVFIILCDARMTIGIENENDINDIMYTLKKNKFEKQFQISILYSDDSNITHCFMEMIK